MGVEQTVCLVAVGGILEVLFVDRSNLFVVGCGAEFEMPPLSPLAIRDGSRLFRLCLNTALKLLDKASHLVSAFQLGDTP